MNARETILDAVDAVGGLLKRTAHDAVLKVFDWDAIIAQLERALDAAIALREQAEDLETKTP